MSPAKKVIFSFIIVTLTGVLTLSCRDDETTSTHGEPRNSGDGEYAGRGLGDYCGETISEPVAWDEITEIGISAEEAFSAVDGTCTSILTWGSDPFEPTGIEPGSGESAVTITASVAEDSSELLTQIDSVGEVDCGWTRLQAAATFTIETEDNIFNDVGEAEVVYEENRGLATIQFEVPLADLGGTLEVALEGDETGELHYRLNGVGDDCAGEVWLQITGSMGGGVMSSGMGVLGSWSNTDCPMGEESIDLEESVGQTELQSALSRMFDENSFPGKWREYEDQEDGDAATLLVEVAVVETTVCTENGGNIRLPVDIVVSTSDGLIENLTARGEVGIALGAGGDVQVYSLNATIESSCESDSDTLPYTGADCAAVESMTTRISIGNPEENEGELGLYLYNRGNTGGEADAYRRLVLNNDR